MALNPSISLGVKGLELANPLAQYGQIAAIQNAQNQNQLAQYQLGAAQRAEATQNVLADAYSQSIDPDTGKINYNKLTGLLAKGGGGAQIPGIEKTRRETEAAALAAKKTEGEIAKNEYELQQKRFNKAWQSAGAAATPQIAIDQLTKAVRSGEIDMATATREIQNLQNMPPEQYRDWRANKILSLMDAKDQYAATVPKVMSQFEAARLPIYQQQANIAQSQLGVSQGQLGLAKQKFAWEQANPGFELKEAEDGSIVGVNKRTLQAFPVSIGGAAPAVAPMAAPAASGMPGARVQAIPGMTSVLDQQAPATAPVAGTPLRGKGTALTESQGNATAYGMRMKEANAILEPLENAGKTNTGLIKGAVSGAVGLVPFIGDKLEDVSGSIFNALPQVLGGLSPEQQKVAQARINFITAILRKESGAAIGASEFATAEKNYFPKPGDDAATIAQKQQARKTAIRAMEVQAGPGAKQMGGAGVLPGATANNPLGLPGL